jgi:osmotically-inducible protein OsmY
MLSSQSPNSSVPKLPESSLPNGRRDIAAEVSNRLCESAYFRLRNVWCDYHEGVLCLRGRVPSFFLKQMAQTIACQVEGVEECLNRIEVPLAIPLAKN